MEKILITGGEGFIGKAVREQLNGEDYEVFVFDKKNGLDINSKKDFDGFKVDYVIHLAALTKAKETEEMLRVNVGGTMNVLEFCNKCRAKLIFASSAAVYGSSLPPLKETSPTNPVSFNGVTKLMAERLCKFYHESRGLESTILRIFNPYGPNQNTGFLIPDIFSKLDQKVVILKNPHPKRDYIHVKDLADAIIKSILLKGFEIINIGSGKSHSVQEVAQMITSKPIRYEDKTLIEDDSYANISKAKKLLGWKPSISLETGLKRLSRRR